MAEGGRGGRAGQGVVGEDGGGVDGRGVLAGGGGDGEVWVGYAVAGGG